MSQPSALPPLCSCLRSTTREPLFVHPIVWKSLHLAALHISVVAGPPPALQQVCCSQNSFQIVIKLTIQCLMESLRNPLSLGHLQSSMPLKLCSLALHCAMPRSPIFCCKRSILAGCRLRITTPAHFSAQEFQAIALRSNLCLAVQLLVC
jgi:hypothetical protein